MKDIVRIESNSRRSRAVIFGGMVHLAGQVANDPTVDIATQTKQTLAEIHELLEQSGSSKRGILNATIRLKTMADYDTMNKVWDGWVEPDATPARCCGTSDLAGEGFLVEIMVKEAQVS